MNMTTGWIKILLMATLSFVAMYGLMYAMVDGYDNVYFNLNQFYMAIMMTAVMMIMEMLIMGFMYDKKIKITVLGLSVIIFALSLICIREQIGISDKAFLKSMIPHHGGALLMCERSNIRDQEIRNLCALIISGQQTEIDWMKNRLSDLK